MKKTETLLQTIARWFKQLVVPTTKFLGKMTLVAAAICLLLWGLVWVLGAAADALTSEAVVFIDPADGVLERGEEWKIHKMTTWSDQSKSFVEVLPHEPLWDEILERGDYDVSYAFDQSGVRFPPMPE